MRIATGRWQRPHGTVLAVGEASKCVSISSYAPPPPPAVGNRSRDTSTFHSLRSAWFIPGLPKRCLWANGSTHAYDILHLLAILIF